MRPLLLALPLLAGSCASVPSRSTAPLPGDDAFASRLALQAGLRSFDEGDWAPVDDQGVLGIEYVYEPAESSVGVEVGFHASERTEDDFRIPPMAVVDVAGRTSELSLGLRKTVPVELDGVHPYVAGGLSILHAELEGESGGQPADDEDDSGGIYLRGGVEFDLSRSFFLGIDLRVRGGSEVELFGSDGSADYGQVALVLGVRF